MSIADRRLRHLLEERARILAQCRESLLHLREAQARMRDAVGAGRKASAAAPLRREAEEDACDRPGDQR